MKSITFHQGIDRIIEEFKLATEHPPDTLAEAERLSGVIPSDLPGRVDLTGEVTVTIDGEKARDFDDAVAVQSLPSGHTCLKVSIADVSHYVAAGSRLDREALQRGTSSYFPDRCLPMLPERLSNDLCSLLPEQPRLTVTAEMEFDAEGRRVGSRFYRSVIRSAARLTYTAVRKILVDQEVEARGQYRSLISTLERMADLAERIRSQRMKRGSLDFDLPEPEIILDLEAGGVEEIIKAERNLAHRLIEEFMIAANEAVAEFITEQGCPMIYRIHEEPDPAKVKDFAMLLHNLGLRVRLGKKVTPASFAQIIDVVRGRPEEKLVNTVLLRTMSQAVYSTRNAGHFGLASKCYTHFTSPIRRYPDLIVHRLLLARLQNKSGMSHVPLEEMARHCSERERNSMKSEWASRDLASAFFMRDKIGEKFEGIISGVSKFGFFVRLNPYLVEGLVAYRNMKDDYYHFNEKAHEAVGRKSKRRFRLGDAVAVEVVGVNLEKRWVDLKLK